MVLLVVLCSMIVKCLGRTHALTLKTGFLARRPIYKMASQIGSQKFISAYV